MSVLLASVALHNLPMLCSQWLVLSQAIAYEGHVWGLEASAIRKDAHTSTHCCVQLVMH